MRAAFGRVLIRGPSSGPLGRGAVQMQKTAERIDDLTVRLVASLFSVP